MIVVVAILAMPACTDTESPTSGTPQITFTKRMHDFGVIADSDDQSTTFSFTNTGTGTLVISEVKATCGCTVPTLTKTEYAPGESATLNVRFDPSGKSGRQNKSISVISNAQLQSVTKLAIRADVRPLVDFNFFLRFGEVKLGQQRTGRVVLSYTDPDLQIRGLGVEHPHLAQPRTDAEVPPGGDDEPELGLGPESEFLLVGAVQHRSPRQQLTRRPQP